MGEHCDQCQVSVLPDSRMPQVQDGPGPAEHPRPQIPASALNLT